MLIQNIKAAQLEARRAKDALKAASLTTLIGEVEALAKNELREVRDEDVLAVTRKFIKNINETLAALQKDASGNNDKIQAFETEKQLYGQFLPQQATAEDLQKALAAAFPQRPDKGSAMKLLKAQFAGNYDGKEAAATVDAFIKSFG